MRAEGFYAARRDIETIAREDVPMEQNGRQPEQPAQTNGFENTEVILEPIQDLGIPNRPRKGNSLAKKRKKRLRQKRLFIALGAVLAVALGFVIYMFVSNQIQLAREAAAIAAAEDAARAQQELERQEFEAMANSTTFLDGITVNGIAIGGMTMDEAKTALSFVQANLDARREIQLVNDNKLYPLDLTGIPSTVNTDSVLAEAYRLGKSGDYASMKAETEEIKANGRDFSLTVSYDLDALAAGVSTIAAQIDVPAADAAVTGIDEDTHKLIIREETVGLAVDQTALLNAITDSLLNGVTTPINIPILVVPPSLTKDIVNSLYVKRGEMTTDFSASDSNRKYNVRKGTALINGTILKPGETFSANDTLGTRTRENGWKIAHAYVQGAIEEQYGGGVCQLSSTLYNAVVKADLEVVYRRNHSMQVNYVKMGLDATINSVGNLIDFQFKNNTAGDIIIVGYTSSSNELTFEIWGLPYATTEYDQIKFTSSLVSTSDPGGDPVEIIVEPGTEKPDGTLMQAGDEPYVAIAPRKGYIYQSYKKYYLKGELVKTEKVAVSTYKAYQGEIWICPPDETPEPTPEDMPWVENTPSPENSP
jgi:vancomycin resistance protein YoaR